MTTSIAEYEGLCAALIAVFAILAVIVDNPAAEAAGDADDDRIPGGSALDP